MSGLFITMEGPDGAGKTTQAKLLGQSLMEQGREVVFTREPGGTRISEVIRNVLLNPDLNEMTAQAEIFLYAAARAQHVQELIVPALKEDKVVICDRFIDSTLAYQGYGRGIDRDLIRAVNDIAIQGLKPDLTLIFDLEPEDGLQRIKEHRNGQVDRLEGEDLSFHLRVRRGFLEIAREEPGRCRVVNAKETVEQVQRKVQELVKELLKG